jgi:hypothetical protein
VQFPIRFWFILFRLQEGTQHTTTDSQDRHSHTPIHRLLFDLSHTTTATCYTQHRTPFSIAKPHRLRRPATHTPPNQLVVELVRRTLAARRGRRRSRDRMGCAGREPAICSRRRRLMPATRVLVPAASRRLRRCASERVYLCGSCN